MIRWSGAQSDRSVAVRLDLTLPGHPNIIVVSDLANFPHQGELLGIASLAMQQGKYAARLIQARLAGQTLPPFHHRDLGTMATIGR